MRAAPTVVMVVALAVAAVAQSRAGQALNLYLIDVEGGNATLITSPSGESILIDTANGGTQAPRDVDRILAAAKDAGLTQIDHLITTHYHTDHIGAMQELVNRFPVKHLYDHGETVEPRPDLLPFVKETYPAIYAKIPRTAVKPGDRVPVKGLDVRIPTSAGLAIKQPLPGAGKANPYCAQFTPVPPDPGENAQSVGTHVTLGRFRMLHLGDLTTMKEFDLMCPANRIGTVDLLVVSHHGQAISNSQLLVHPLEARAMLMNNGVRKGGQPEAMKVLHSAPGLEDIWQLHFSQLSGQEYTVPGLFIANLVDAPATEMPIAPLVPPARGTPGAQPPPVHNGQAYWLKVTGREDGSFTVTNARNGFAKTYAARSAR